MKIVISDVHRDLKINTGMNCERFISIDVTEFDSIIASAHERGSVCLRSEDNFYSGVYVTCLDAEGYPL